MRVHFPPTSFIGYLRRRSPIASSRVAAPLAQCVPMLTGLSKTGSCAVQTPFSTSAQIEQPTAQNGQTVLTRLASGGGDVGCVVVCAVTRRFARTAAPARPPIAVRPEARRNARRERPKSFTPSIALDPARNRFLPAAELTRLRSIGDLLPDRPDAQATLSEAQNRLRS